jgi:multisubunit Na+/H+ antiporter MnhB subunit
MLRLPTGEVCCARYTNQYFRAVITDIAEHGEMATVSFVDYGNMETMALSK